MKYVFELPGTGTSHLETPWLSPSVGENHLRNPGAAERVTGDFIEV